MLNLFMSLVLAGVASGFLGWAGLLGSANGTGKLLFFVLLALALATALLGFGRFLLDLVRSRRFRRAGHARA